MSELGEHDFKRGDNREQIGRVVIAEVRETKNFALHRALPIGDDRAEASAQLLDDGARIHAGGRRDGGQGVGGRALGKELQAQALGRRPRRLREHPGIRDQLLAPQPADVFECGVERHYQRGGGRETHFALGERLPLSREMKVVARQAGALDKSPGLLADAREGEARGHHQRLL